MRIDPMIPAMVFMAVTVMITASINLRLLDSVTVTGDDTDIYRARESTNTVALLGFMLLIAAIVMFFVKTITIVPLVLLLVLDVSLILKLTTTFSLMKKLDIPCGKTSGALREPLSLVYRATYYIQILALLFQMLAVYAGFTN